LVMGGRQSSTPEKESCLEGGLVGNRLESHHSQNGASIEERLRKGQEVEIGGEKREIDPRETLILGGWVCETDLTGKRFQNLWTLRIGEPHPGEEDIGKAANWKNFISKETPSSILEGFEYGSCNE